MAVGLRKDTDLNAELDKLRRGKALPVDLDVEIVRPKWFNEEKYLRGKKFFEENLMCIFLSEIFYMFAAFSFPRILKVLISTDKSSTPITALKRYVTTIRITMCWFRGDLWDPENLAFKSMRHTIKSHKNARTMMNSDKKKETDTMILKPSTDDKPHLYKTIQTSKSPLLTDVESNYPYVSQWDMMILQHVLTAAVIIHSEAHGVWNASNEDLEGYIHFWRVLGHLLGIKDEFNLCRGDLNQTKSILFKIEEQELIPSMGRVDYDFEHMSSALVDGLRYLLPIVTYPSALFFFMDTLGADTRKLYKSLTLKQKINYYFIKMITYSCKARFIKNLYNSLFEISLDLVEGGGPWWWPSVLTPSVTIPPCRYRIP